MYVESSDLQLCIPCRFRSDLQDFQCFAQTFNQRHVVSGYWASDQIQTFDRGADVPASMLNLTNFSSQFSNFLFCLCLFSFDSVLLCIHQWIRSDKILAFSENYRTYLFRFYQKVCRLFSALFFLRILPPNEKSSQCESYCKFCRGKIPKKKLLISQLLLTLSPLPAGDCCLTGLSQKSRS